MKIRQLLATIYLLFLSFSVNGQDEERIFWNYNVTHGLPTNSLYHILLDKKGRIWFGSDKGVTCFDGNSFRTFTTDDGLSDNTVIRCYEDSRGRIWFHHLSALPTYYQNGTIHQLDSENTRVPTIVLSNLVEMPNGHLFIGFSSGFVEIDNKNKYQKHFVNHGPSHACLFSLNNTLYLGSSDQKPIYFKGIKVHNFHTKNNPYYKLWQKDPSSILNNIHLYRSQEFFIESFVRKDFSFYNSDLKPWLNNTKIFHIVKHKSSYYVGTSKGIYVFQFQNGKLKMTDHYLKNISVVSLAFNYQGDIWATSNEKGLFHIPSFNYSRISDLSNGRMLSAHVWNDSLFFSGEANQLYHYSKTKKINNKNTKGFNSRYSIISDFYFYGSNKIWISSEFLYIKINNDSTREKRIGKAIKEVFAQKQSPNLLFLFGEGGIVKLDLTQKDPQPENFIQGIGRVRCLGSINNRLIAGTQGGVFECNSQIPKPLFQKELGYAKINKILTFEDKILIVTENKGLWFYDGKKLSRFVTKNSMLDRFKGAYKGSNNSFWVHSDIGIQKFELFGNEYHEVGRIDIRTNLQIDDLFNLIEYKDEVFLLTNNGVISLPAKKLKSIRKGNLFMESYQVDGQLQEFSKVILLPNNQKRIVFHLTSINSTKHASEFYYRINGSDWILNNSNKISFSALSPEEYVFDFKIESPFYETAFLRNIVLKVEKRWWQSTLILILVFAISFLLAVLIVRWRILKIQERKRRSLASELFSLQSQMNPHFTFNSLNSIQSYLSTNDKRSAQIYLADFAILMRNIMDQAKLNLITLEEEITFLTQYLNLERRRLDNTFDYTFQIDQRIVQDQTFIPTLMLQPFVENAIWHGVAALDYPGKIEISFGREGENLICEIVDNGLGINSDKKNKSYHKSTGIENVKERMRLFEELFKKKMELKITDNAQNGSEGLCVRIVIPKLTMKNKLT
jgi:ligand-binding sensor domain-containing protein